MPHAGKINTEIMLRIWDKISCKYSIDQTTYVGGETVACQYWFSEKPVLEYILH